MNWILFSLLLIMTGFAYKSHKKIILHPTVLVFGMFMLSTLVLCLNPEWKYEVAISTICYLFFALVAFALGVKIGSSNNSRVQISSIQNEQLLAININKKAMVVVCAICIGVSYAYAKNQYAAAAALGNVFGWPGVIMTLRNALNTDLDVFQLSTPLNLGISFTRAISYTSLFLLLTSIINRTSNWKWYVIPIACLFVNLVLSTGRGGFINFVAVVIFDIYIICKIKGIKDINKKITRYAVVGFSVFMVIFLALGTLTGKDEVLSVWDQISIYIGSSVLCFDYLLGHGGLDSSFFGMHTFKGFYGLLGRFTPGISSLGNHSEKVLWSNYSSNVYSAFGAYYADFGVIGSILFLVFVGYIFGKVWTKYINLRKVSILAVVYGRFFGYALCMFSIAERLCSEFLALNVFVEILMYYMIFKYCLKYSYK